MTERGLDVLLVTHPANVYYLSGYDAYSFDTPQVLIVTPDSAQPIDVWREQIEGTHVEKESRIGYSTGIGYPPTWIERTANIRPGDETILEENMVFHPLAGVWFDDYGIEISESFRVIGDGAETFAAFPRELVVKS